MIHNYGGIYMKKLLIIVCLFFSLSLFGGCATTTTTNPDGTTTTVPAWIAPAETGYNITGIILTTAKTMLDIVGNMGVLTEVQYNQYSAIYNQALEAYKAVGSALEIAKAATTAGQQAGAMAAYNAAMAKLGPLVVDVTKLINDLHLIQQPQKLVKPVVGVEAPKKLKVCK